MLFKPIEKMNIQQPTLNNQVRHKKKNEVNAILIFVLPLVPGCLLLDIGSSVSLEKLMIQNTQGFQYYFLPFQRETALCSSRAESRRILLRHECHRLMFISSLDFNIISMYFLKTSITFQESHYAIAFYLFRS